MKLARLGTIFGIVLFFALVATADRGWTIYKDIGPFVVSLAQDQQGNFWVGTEEQGVFRFSPNLPEDQQWEQFTKKNGLGDDNAYAITCDKLGRVWVGTRNHGVSVFSGGKWKTYDLLEGPLGERIFAMATCPTDGDVWMATSAGLTRYSLTKDTWSHITVAEGLPSNQISSLAFDSKGNLCVGMQADGLAMSMGANNYATWRVITAPHPGSSLPLTPNGLGLPTNLINDVLVTRDGTILAATSAGLAWSTDEGNTWSYLRGKDYADKICGLLGGAPKGWKETADKDSLLPEDFISCLAEAEDGTLWLGFRAQGFAALVPPRLEKTKKQNKPLLNTAANSLSPIILPTIIYRSSTKIKGMGDDDIKCLLPSADKLYFGTFGGGFGIGKELLAGQAQASIAQSSALRPPPSSFPPLPTPAKSPSLVELNSFLNRLRQIPPSATNSPTILALDDDWRTEGDWLGRYGRYWACLAATCSPQDYVWGAGSDKVEYAACVGRNTGINNGKLAPEDTLRYWVHWMYTTDPRVLELPPTYLHSRVLKKLTTWTNNRREAEWDDHGETYPWTLDGPNLYCTLKIPAGQYCLSFYFINPNGHDGANRIRDYRLSLRLHSGKLLLDVSQFSLQPELAHGRASNFWGGVWKKYLVRGPTEITLEVNRNSSFNTLMSAVMLDELEAKPAPYYHPVAEWKNLQVEQEKLRQTLIIQSRDPQFQEKRLAPASTGAGAADLLFVEMENLRLTNPLWWAVLRKEVYTPLARYLREGQMNEAQAAKLATCYFYLNLFDQAEKLQRQEGVATSREIEKALRWDGKTWSYNGKGLEIITAYLITTKGKVPIPTLREKP